MYGLKPVPFKKRVLTEALKPDTFSPLRPDLKSCPDTKRSFSAACKAFSWVLHLRHSRKPPLGLRIVWFLRDSYINLRYPALPCRTTGRIVPAGLQGLKAFRRAAHLWHS
jgi:hypothetical protein